MAPDKNMRLLALGVDPRVEIGAPRPAIEAATSSGMHRRSSIEQHEEVVRTSGVRRTARGVVTLAYPYGLANESGMTGNFLGELLQ